MAGDSFQCQRYCFLLQDPADVPEPPFALAAAVPAPAVVAALPEARAVAKRTCGVHVACM